MLDLICEICGEAKSITKGLVYIYTGLGIVGHVSCVEVKK